MQRADVTAAMGSALAGAAAAVGRAIGRRPVLLAAEPARATTELAGFVLLAPVLAWVPRGDGHAVLVIPGWLAGDRSTVPLRRCLRLLGYRVRGWGQGVNRGPTVGSVAGVRRRLVELAAESAGPVSVIGWSLGGLYAYELAARNPANVRQVITLGSPARSRPTTARTASRVADAVAHRGVLPPVTPRPWREAGSLRVPITAVYSRTDGVVPWRACLIAAAPRRQNIAVHGSHLGLGHNPAVVHIIADRLAQPAGKWQPFRPRPLLRNMYPEPDAGRSTGAASPVVSASVPNPLTRLAAMTVTDRRRCGPG